MTTRQILGRAAWLVLGLAAVGALVGTWEILGLGPQRPPGPTVILRAPGYGDEVGANDDVQVQAIAYSSTGVTRVELWVDDQLRAVETSQLPAGSSPFPFLELWQPGAVGGHALILRAFDGEGRTGQATAFVEALDRPRTPPSDQYEVREGDTVESVAQDLDVSAEEIAALNPDLSGEPAAGSVITVPTPRAESEASPAESEAPTPTPAPLGDPPVPEGLRGGGLDFIPGFVRRWLDPLPDSGTLIEVEFVDLYVFDDYDGVFCYVSLAEPSNPDTERMPEDGYLSFTEGFNWGIEEEAGGEHRRLVSLPLGQPLEVEIDCYGFRNSEDGGDTFNLGHVLRTYPESDWDGRRLQAQAVGPDGAFRVAFKIWPAGEHGWTGELPTPVLTMECFQRWVRFETPWCTMRWTMEGPNFLHIDGYLVLMNGSLLFQTEGSTPYPVYLFERGAPVLPPCGETWEYQVVAYSGNPLMGPPEGLLSTPSNIVTVGPATTCPRDRVVTLALNYLHVCTLHVDCPVCWGICRWGLGVPADESQCGGDVGCDPDYADIYGDEVYGSITANGRSLFSLMGSLDSGTIFRLGGSRGRSTTFPLAESDSLTISMSFYDYDAMSDDDPFCHHQVVISPEDQVAIRDSGGSATRTSTFWDDGGTCFLNYTIRVSRDVLPMPDYEPMGWP